MHWLLTFSSILTGLNSWASATPVPQGNSPQSPLAHVKNGTYQGVHNTHYNQDYFLALPYAQPPTGSAGRLNFPRSLNSSFQGVSSAQQYGPACVGYGPDNLGAVSEDCLTLNVFRPCGYENQMLPVGVWIFGGGFVFGNAAAPQYNMSAILQNSVEIGKPIITVTINYRLSGWGWLWGDDVQAAGVTNLGLRDQRLALAWIQENIGAFGGDHSKVTIWGESAGAGSVGMQSTAFGGRDDKLFRGMIAESGPPLQEGYYPLPLANAVYDNITRDTGCSTAADKLQCLRDLPYSTLDQALNTTYPFLPAVDGDFNQQLGSIQLAQGEFTKTPFLVGTNSDEGTTFEPLGINTDQDFIGYLNGLGVTDNTTLQEFLQDYPDIPSQGLPATLPGRPNSTIGLQYKRETAFTTDYTFGAGRRFTSHAWVNQSVPVYTYRFNTLSNGYSSVQGITHYTEVAYVFDDVNGYGDNPNQFTNEPVSHQNVAHLMSKAWVSFIHDLDPNNHGVQGTPHWPAYSNAQPQNFVFDANVTSLAYTEADTFRSPGIDLINSINAQTFHR